MTWKSKLQTFFVEAFFDFQVKFLNAIEILTTVEIAPPVDDFQVERRIEHSIKGDDDIRGFRMCLKNRFQNFQRLAYTWRGGFIGETIVEFSLDGRASRDIRDGIIAHRLIGHGDQITVQGPNAGGSKSHFFDCPIDATDLDSVADLEWFIDKDRDGAEKIRDGILSGEPEGQTQDGERAEEGCNIHVEIRQQREEGDGDEDDFEGLTTNDEELFVERPFAAGGEACFGNSDQGIHRFQEDIGNRNENNDHRELGDDSFEPDGPIEQLESDVEQEDKGDDFHRAIEKVNDDVVPLGGGPGGPGLQSNIDKSVERSGGDEGEAEVNQRRQVLPEGFGKNLDLECVNPLQTKTEHGTITFDEFVAWHGVFESPSGGLQGTGGRRWIRGAGIGGLGKGFGPDGPDGEAGAGASNEPGQPTKDPTMIHGDQRAGTGPTGKLCASRRGKSLPDS